MIENENFNRDLEYLRKEPLSELGDVFEILAERVDQERGKNNSLVPSNIFTHCLAIGGVSSVVEILIGVYKGNNFGSYALKKREPNETGWQELYQIPGTVARLNDSTSDLFKRLNDEIWGKENPPSYMCSPQYFGAEMHKELLRSVVRTSRLYVAKIDEDKLRYLDGDWKIFQNGKSDEIIDHHKDLINWAQVGKGGGFVDFPPSN